MTLLMVVERHLRKNAVSPSRFGRQVSGDPRFVFDLRRGREPRPATAARVLAHIAQATAGNPGVDCAQSGGILA
jgi:hypothetical protein